jgi:hypothetical protein
MNVEIGAEAYIKGIAVAVLYSILPTRSQENLFNGMSFKRRIQV